MFGVPSPPGTIDPIGEAWPLVARVAEILSDFRTLQFYIAGAPAESDNAEDYYTEGWAAMRQCAIDGHHILECAADTRVPVTQGGEEEQTKAELKQSSKAANLTLRYSLNFMLAISNCGWYVTPICLVRAVAQADELASITDEHVYAELAASDQILGRWTVEDPSLRSVLRWLRARQR
ncbi:hypothetical protein O9K51_06281 [Purpureocillium lavendulum]|uniref:Uncharacterized protein n=1 Tax=Purpureocillium lavendulum TaxID=1247861 RepID=A0AB34FNR3_9HYPO|nr:hypothetical protein O9K51_06281 [Purpureocillium lavendulum]